MELKIRPVRWDDLEQVAAIEGTCFPRAEAASRESLCGRINAFPGNFLVAEGETGKLIGFINGCVTSQRTISDCMFENTDTHQPDGDYQSVFGLDVLPEYQKQGVAAKLMEEFIRLARKDRRKGVILTCKEKLIPYYSKFGFQNQGVSESTHGGATWYDMLLLIED